MNEMAHIVLQIAHKTHLPVTRKIIFVWNYFVTRKKKQQSKKLRHVPGPQGVRGRNSNNDVVRQHLKWEPKISLRDGSFRIFLTMPFFVSFRFVCIVIFIIIKIRCFVGIARTFVWIAEQVEADRRAGVDIARYASSKVVALNTPDAVATNIRK